MTLYKWSTTAATNGLADSTCSFPEGMSPAAINDGTRGMMAAIAKHRDDISGQITTSGSSTAYVVSSFQQFDSLADMHGKEVWFTPHVTNAQGSPSVMLNTDVLGNKPLRLAPGVELPAGVIIQGTPYGAVYNNTDGAWYLKGYFGQPTAIPLGGIVDFAGTTAPNSQFVLPFGQQISITTYASLYALFGANRFGTDTGTLFFLPDLRGRVTAGLDNMGSVAAGRIGTLATDAGTIVGTTLGSTGGSQSHALTVGEIPTLAVSASGSASVSFGGGSVPWTASGGWGTQFNNDATGNNTPIPGSSISSISGASGSASVTGNTTNTGGGNHAMLQPTIMVNKLLRII